LGRISNIELLIFDLDGTLVDSRYDLCDSVNYALQEMGLPTLNYGELPALLGSGLPFLLKKATASEDEKILRRAHALFWAHYEKNNTNKTCPYPGVVETLGLLKNRKKAVFSNKPHAFTKDIIKGLDLSPFFVKVMGARPERYQTKPSPEGIHYILESLNVKPQNTLMIGDSTHDVEAGKAAGTFTCAVSYGYRSDGQLRASGPDLMIKAFAELKSLFA